MSVTLTTTGIVFHHKSIDSAYDYTHFKESFIDVISASVDRVGLDAITCCLEVLRELTLSSEQIEVLEDR